MIEFALAPWFAQEMATTGGAPTDEVPGYLRKGTMHISRIHVVAIIWSGN